MDDLMVLKEHEKIIADAEQFTNSLGSLCEGLQSHNLFGSVGNQLSQTDTLFNNNRWYLISNLRQLLSQIYVEHGIVQTLVDQPVDDAFRAGFEIKTNQLSKDELETLEIYCEENGVIDSLMYASKWSRLYGGGGVIIITDQDPETPLDLNRIKENSPIEYRDVDLWELYYATQNASGDLYPGGDIGASYGDFYNYYGHRVHKSRVLRIVGKKAPAFIRPRLRGWGMSELERLVRSLNQYLKNQDVIFELLDEAKVDVFKIKGFNTALATNAGTKQLAARTAAVNQQKNFQSGIMMDSQDDYIQKQITFSGLAEVLLQIRQGIAADLKMPMTKLFGISSAGFNSGEDDIENYNSMIEGEIRRKAKFQMVALLKIASQKCFGMIPDDLMINFNPLRILNAKEEEEVKDSKFNRVISGYTSGLTSAQEAKQGINRESLLPVEVDEDSEALPPVAGDFTVEGEAKGSAGKQTKTEA